MHSDEGTPLLQRNLNTDNGLSVFFAIICVVDVFGVFPVVTLPKAIIDCGYYGVLVVCVVCSIQIYTAILLGKCWSLAEQIQPSINNKSRYPYSALAEVAFGKCYAYIVTFLVDLTVFGGGIPNLIVAAQNIQLLGLRISDNTFNVSYCYWILILGTILCPVLWLGSPKDMKILCTISVLIVSSVFLLTCGCLLFTTNEDFPLEDVNFDTNLDLWKLTMTAYGIISFQFDIHPTILTIQMDMKRKDKLPLAILGGFLVCLLMSGVTTLIAAIKFGPDVKPSILETLPTSVPLHFAAALVALQLCLTSAVSNSALYQHMENCLNISREFNHKRCILRTILTLLAMLIAESVPRFDLAMSLIGGTLTGPLVFILPPLFYIRILYLHKKYRERIENDSFTNIILTKQTGTAAEDLEEYSKDLTKYYEKNIREEFRDKTFWNLNWAGLIFNKKFEIILCIVIIIVSICTTCVTTYLNVDNAALSYSNFSKPCIYNISNTLLYL